MIRLTLRLPESLHGKLAEQAQRKRVSLNHHILVSLARAVNVTDLGAQQEAFERRRNRFPAEEAEAALEEQLAARS